MISLTTIALNEIGSVNEFVDAVQKHVDEIVIVDTGSSDGTQARLRELGCVVIETTVAEGLGAARNLGLARCSGDWILSLDFDERPQGTMMKWIAKFVTKATKMYNAVLFQRDNLLDGELYSTEWHPRLFRRGKGSWEGTIHEGVVYTGRGYKAPDSARILHNKSTEQQARCNRRYLAFYPKLNLGSGGLPKPVDEGWINYDLNPDAPHSTYADVFEELPGDLPASYIFASHVLEHTSYHRTSHVLKMWLDKLAPGGTIEIRAPDLDAVIAGFLSGSIPYLRFLQLMFGGHATKHDYHNMAINQGWLTGQLTWWGCVDIERQAAEAGRPELRMTARKPL